MTYYDRADWPSERGWPPDELTADNPHQESVGLYREWAAHLVQELPELAVHDAIHESGLASQRLEFAVVTAKKAGASWERIATAAGMKRQSAHERWKHLVAEPTTDTTPPTAAPASGRIGLSHPTLRQLVDGSTVAAHPMPTEQAMTLGRHVKAALMHLSEAERIAADAGIDITGPGIPSQPGYDLAALFGSALDTTEELDGWAVNNARANGGGRATYAHTERWCHTPGGALPDASLQAGDGQ